MTHEVNRGIGFTVQRIGDEIKFLLPYLDPLDPVMSKFRQPSVTFPADASPEGTSFADMDDKSIVSWVRSSIQG